MVKANLPPPPAHLSLPLPSVSPHSFSISASFYNATRRERKEVVYKDLRSHLGNQCAILAPTDTTEFRALFTVQSIVFNFS